MYNLVVCYEYGTGCKKDLIKAKEFYEKAAKLGLINGNFSNFFIIVDRKTILAVEQLKKMK